jgi:hypothetical protein
MLFWFPKKLIDFSNPENIVLTIAENMDIAGVGNYKALTKLIDGCSFISASLNEHTRYYTARGPLYTTMRWGRHDDDDCVPDDPLNFGDN